MVIEDLSDLPKNIDNSPAKPQLQETVIAPAADRLLASFLDFLLHFPLFHLFVSVFLHKLKILKWVTESNTESLYVTIQCIMILLVATLFFQAIYFKVLRFTPGMYFLKLRAKSFHTDEITWGQAFLRSAFWIFGILSLGVPFLEIFSHQKRRLLHDRVSETEIYSLKKNVLEKPPIELESSMVRLFFATIAVVFLGWVNAYISFSQSEIESGRLAVSEFTERGLLCEDVNEVANRSNVDIQSIETRLEFATALFMLGQLDQSCLNRELDYASLKNEHVSNRFFSKAVLAPSHSEDRKKYLDLACEENKKWCDIGYLLDAGVGKDLYAVLAKLKKGWSTSSWSFKVAALKIFNQLGQGEQALAVITNLQNDGLQATGLIEQQLRALQRSNRKAEAEEVLRGVHSVVVNRDYAHLSSALCLESIDENCGKADSSCKHFAEIMVLNKDLMGETGPARTLFKYLTCEKQLIENMEYWSLIENEDLQNLVQWSFYLQQPAMKADALVKLRDFVQDEAKIQILRWDALQILLKNTNYEKDWDLALNFWNEFSPFNDSYFSASRWLVGYAKKQKKETQVALLEKILTTNPAFNTDKSARLPAGTAQITEKK